MYTNLLYKIKLANIIILMTMEVMTASQWILITVKANYYKNEFTRKFKIKNDDN